MVQSNTWRKRFQRMGFLGLPPEVIITLGKAKGECSLTALDKAEFDACIPDINAMVVTSFVPPGATLIMPDESKQYLQDHPVVPGSLVPAALKYYSATRDKQQRCEVKTNKLFAAIAVLAPEDKDTFPSIMMEYAGPSEPWDPATRSDVEKHCIDMCVQVADIRKDYGFRPQGDPKIWIVEEELPEDGSWVCVLAAGIYVKNMPF